MYVGLFFYVVTQCYDTILYYDSEGQIQSFSLTCLPEQTGNRTACKLSLTEAKVLTEEDVRVRFDIPKCWFPESGCTIINDIEYMIEYAKVVKLPY